jgi:DNA-binding CsgD family transcriptional regulator
MVVLPEQLRQMKLKVKSRPSVAVRRHSARTRRRAVRPNLELSPDQERRRLACRLTVRQAQVLLLISQGLTSRQIARRLAIRPRTATTHGQKIHEKLGVHTRAAAVTKFLCSKPARAAAANMVSIKFCPKCGCNLAAPGKSGLWLTRVASRRAGAPKANS